MGRVERAGMTPAGRLSVGDVLNRVFALYKEHFGVLIPVAFWLFLVVSILGGILSRTNALALLIFFVVTFAAALLYQGMVVELVQDIQDGRRDHSVAELLRSVSPVFWQLLGVSILFGIGVAIGFVLLIVPGLILLTIWSVVAPVTVLERPGVFAAFDRSLELTHQQRLRLRRELREIILQPLGRCLAHAPGMHACVGDGEARPPIIIKGLLLRSRLVLMKRAAAATL